VSNRESLRNLESWIEQAQRYKDPSKNTLIIAVMGNKQDLRDSPAYDPSSFVRVEEVCGAGYEPIHFIYG